MHRLVFSALALLLNLFGLFVSNAQENQINLLAFKYNGQEQTSELIKWNVDSPENYTAISTDVIGITVGTSTFNAANGDYISRVIQSGDPDTSGIFSYNTLTETTGFNAATSFYNGSAECNMRSGFIYTYDGNELNEVVLNEYNPQTNELTVIGTFNFEPNTSLFPDGSCFDSNTGTYYFIMQDSQGKKLVRVPINAPEFTYTETLLTGLPITGNIGLEFSNETNSIYCMYASYNEQTESSSFVIGNIDTSNGEIVVLNQLDTIGGYQYYNRTFDQTTKKLIFVAYNLDFSAQELYLYDMDTNTYETRAMPAEVVLEIECNNFAYSELRYGPLNNPAFQANALGIYLDMTTRSIHFSESLVNTNFQVCSAQGAIVLSGKINSTNSLDASSLAAGVYVVSVEFAGKKVNKKVIVY